MAADIVNLRQARKRKARAGKEAKAEENRRLFGQPLAERRHRKAIEELEERNLSGAQRVGSAADTLDKTAIDKK
jgi:hypothetical protein